MANDQWPWPSAYGKKAMAIRGYKMKAMAIGHGLHPPLQRKCHGKKGV